MINRLTKMQTIRWHRRLPVLLMLAAGAGLTVLAVDAEAKIKRATIPPVEKAPRAAGEPIMAIVSIKSQQVTLYDADGWISRAPVSTGIKGRETPAGVFAVIEKEVEHYSTLYDDASMPHMQRITWNGLALHGGPLPGYAASHGCIRMPYRFAENLFGKTRIGMRVIISPGDAAPVAFSHPALFEPNAEVVAAAPARADRLVREAEEAAQSATQAKKAAAKAAREAKSAKVSLKKLQRDKTRTEAVLSRADKQLAGVKVDGARELAKVKKNEERELAKAEKIEAKAFAKIKVNEERARKRAKTDEERTLATAKAEEERALAIAKTDEARALTKAKAGEAEALVKAKTDKAIAHADDKQIKATAKVDEAVAKLDAATKDAQLKRDAAAAANDAAKAAATRKAEAAVAAKEAKLALEPVSVYISRATRKLYVRRNTHKPWPDGGEVFDASIEVPVTIDDPDKPIGTHIFTAMAHDGSGLRWSAVTIDNEDDAGDALDRITIPQEILDRIASTVTPRSSIIVSDEPLSSETNYRTEFVAVLSNQPQGGFKTRKPTPKAPDSNYNIWGDGGYSYGYGYYGSQRQDSQHDRRRRDWRDTRERRDWRNDRRRGGDIYWGGVPSGGDRR